MSIEIMLTLQQLLNNLSNYNKPRDIFPAAKIPQRKVLKGIKCLNVITF